MTKKPNTAEQPAAGTAVPENMTPAIPAHKRTYITRHGGSVVLPASSVDVQADSVSVANPTSEIITEENRDAQKP